MKTLSRILTMCLFVAPMVSVDAWGVVATTSGHNLTAYNPSEVHNNQWATLSNGRGDMAAPTAKADFGNCNSVILRCAQPKCGNGGCTDLNVATAIVAGCVQSNEGCKQYGNELVSYMAAQMVASSTAKANAQKAAAEAAAAAQNTQSEQTAQQIALMQQQMQQQMAQMQQQMAQQNAQTQQQLQDALSQQREQNAAALESMKTAATPAVSASAPTPVAETKSDTNLTPAQTEAIQKGISDEVLERQKITGQIMTLIENADTSLAGVKKAMNNAFEYAGCDARGNGCSGPKRVKKFRELALDFIDPYDNVADQIYDALDTAQLVGVDITPIYMMLNNSCKEWGSFLCPHMQNGQVFYKENGTPEVCAVTTQLVSEPVSSLAGTTFRWVQKTEKSNCRDCTLNRKLSSNEDIYAGWVNFDADVSGANNVVVACSSGLLESNSFFKRRAKHKNGAGLVDIDFIDRWLSQVEPNSPKNIKSKNNKITDYCFGDSEQEKVLKTASLSKTVFVKSSKTGEHLCVKDIGSTDYDEECPYINPIYAICDTHVYNAGNESNSSSSSARDAVREIIGLKTTVLAQQMYKQYEYLAATLRRLKTHLEKAVFSADLQAAGAKSENGGSSSESGGFSQYTNKNESIYLAGAGNCYTGDTESALNCLQTNLRTIQDSIKQRKKACQQLVATVLAAKDIFESIPDKDGNAGDVVKPTTSCDNFKDVSKCSSSTDEAQMRTCMNGLIMNISTARQAVERNRNSYRYGR